jgi:hypothetical protein
MSDAVVNVTVKIHICRITSVPDVEKKQNKCHIDIIHKILLSRKRGSFYFKLPGTYVATFMGNRRESKTDDSAVAV